MTDSRHSAEMSDAELFEDDGDDSGLPEQQVELDGGGPAAQDSDPEGAPQSRQANEDPFDDDSDGQPPEHTPQPFETADSESQGDDDGDEPAETYSKKVQRRINKEVARRKSVETEAERLARENDELRQRLGQTETQVFEHSVSGLESQKTTLRGQLAKAIEDGDTEKQVDLTEQLGSVNYRLEQAQQMRARIAPRQQQQPTGERQGEPRPQQQRPQAPTTPAQQREAMIRSLPPRSQEWVSERGFFDWKESQRAYAMGVDAELTKEGFDVGTDEYYVEMDRRIAAAFPDLYDDDDPAPRPQPRKQTQGATPVAPPSAPPAAPNGAQQQGSKVKLGPADFQQMRTFGLDPQDPEAVRAFAMEKQRSARAAQ